MVGCMGPFFSYNLAVEIHSLEAQKNDAMEAQLKNPSIAWLFTGWRTQPLAQRRVCRAIPLSETRLWRAAQDECALDSAAIAYIEPEVRVSINACVCARGCESEIKSRRGRQGWRDGGSE